MTAIISLAFHDKGIVCSDGRVKCDGAIVDDSYNKTFSVFNGAIMGAFANTMEFHLSSFEHGKKISEHISEIVYGHNPINFNQVVELIKGGLRYRLQVAAHRNDFTFDKRSVELLLIGKENIQDGNFQLVHLSFVGDFQNQQIEIKEQWENAVQGNPQFFIIPPDGHPSGTPLKEHMNSI